MVKIFYTNVLIFTTTND